MKIGVGKERSDGTLPRKSGKIIVENRCYQSGIDTLGAQSESSDKLVQNLRGYAIFNRDFKKIYGNFLSFRHNTQEYAGIFLTFI